MGQYSKGELIMYVVVTGNPVDGLIFWGPFKGYDNAVEWAALEFSSEPESWWVSSLENPTLEG